MDGLAAAAAGLLAWAAVAVMLAGVHAVAAWQIRGQVRAGRVRSTPPPAPEPVYDPVAEAEAIVAATPLPPGAWEAGWFWQGQWPTGPSGQAGEVDPPR